MMRAAVILLPLMSVGESQEYMNIRAVQDRNIKEHAADRGKLAIALLFHARNCAFSMQAVEERLVQPSNDWAPGTYYLNSVIAEA
jgi:hypothetical protein